MPKSMKAVAVVALMLLGGTGAWSCGTKRTEVRSGPIGKLSLALTLPTGTVITSVEYMIHSAQPTSPPADKTGTIDISDDMAMPTLETSFPASTDDLVTLTATTARGEPCSGTSDPFSVVPNAQALVGVRLVCGLLTADLLNPDASAGSVRINGTVVDDSDVCPVLNSWTVSPLQTGTTGTITVSATASDGDPGDNLTYRWTATPAPATDPFTNSGAGSTAFHCPGNGIFALTITVDDHHVVQNCTASRTISVECGLCGNGILDPGEACDSPAAFANNTCNPNTCQLQGGECGDGIVVPGEACDSAAAFANNTCAPPGGVTVLNVPPPGSHTISACQSIPTVCGNGLVQPGEECEPPNTATCDSSCFIITACRQCENNTSGPACVGVRVTPTSPFGCSGLTGAAIVSCNNLHTCLDQHPNCSNPANVAPPNDDPTACFCGALSAAACSNAPPSTIAGPCAAAYYAVYGGANRDAVLADFFNKATAVGMANDLYSCDVSNGCLSLTCP
jgi:hypothetical protein